MSEPEILISPMLPEDGAAVLAIYAEGIATGNATFQTEVPSWAEWDAAHLEVPRLVARDPGGSVLGR
jgi:phosphinothricin acetyltransferase